MPFGISKNLFQRIVSAVLLLPPVLGALWAGGWWWAAFLVFGGLLMAREWAALTIPDSKIGLASLAAAVAGLLIWAQFISAAADSVLWLVLGIGALGVLLVKARLFGAVGWWLAGFSYVGVALIAMWWLRSLDEGQLVLWVFLVVWATDIGGYLFGKNIGGPKLAPSISPKKTWSGLMGGVAFSIAASLGLQFAFGLGITITNLVIAAALLAVWAQAGDLVESGIKRHFGVKDSGELIPGHGGLLDRVDGLVFVAPAVALLVFYVPQLFQMGL